MPSTFLIEYLVGAFRDLGMIVHLGMGGMAPLPFHEIDAYARRAGGLDDGDVMILRAMSVSFIDGYNAGKNALAIPPWSPADDKEEDD